MDYKAEADKMSINAGKAALVLGLASIVAFILAVVNLHNISDYILHPLFGIPLLPQGNLPYFGIALILMFFRWELGSVAQTTSALLVKIYSHLLFSPIKPEESDPVAVAGHDLYQKAAEQAAIVKMNVGSMLFFCTAQFGFLIFITIFHWFVS